MSRRTQKESGEERVTGKSKPMMSLIARRSERAPSALSSTASESSGKTRQESQTLLSPQVEKYDGTGRPVVYAHSSSYSEWNIDITWSSQEWKSDELMDDRTERPVVSAQHTDRIIVENDETNSYAEAESELSSGSRSFLHRVNDQVRKRQKQSSKGATKDSDEHSVMWGILCLQNCKCLHSWWKITDTIFILSKIPKISQWNRCSTYLRNWCPNNKMRSMEWRQLTGKTLHGSICLWLVTNKSWVSSAQKPTYSQILYCVLERWTTTLNQIWHGKTDKKMAIPWTSTDYGDLRTTRKNASQMPNSLFSKERDSKQENGNSLGPNQKKKSCSISEKQSTRWIGTKWLKWWCQSAKADSQSSESRIHCPDQCLKAKVTGENCQQSLKCVKMNLGTMERRGGGRCERTIESFVRAKCDEVKHTFAEHKLQKKDNELKTFHNKIDWTNFVQMLDSALQMKSDIIFMTKDTEEFSQFTDSLACREHTLSRDADSTDSKSWPSISSHEPFVQRSAQKQRRWKIVDPLMCRLGNDYNCFSHNYCCKDMENELESYHNKTDWTNFVRMQDSWLLFKSDSISWRKDTEEFLQFTDSVACREYTLPRDEDSSEPKGWISTKIGPVLEVTTCCLQGKYGVEIRIMSVNNDNSHSWVRIFSWPEQVGHGLEQQGGRRRQRAGNLWDEVRRICVEIKCKWFCKPIKGQSKTTKTRFCQLIHKNYTYWGKNLYWQLNHKNIRPPIIQCRRNWWIFFVMEVYLETMMER